MDLQGLLKQLNLITNVTYVTEFGKSAFYFCGNYNEMIRLFLIGFMAFSSIILYSQLHVSLEEAITSSLANSRLKKTAILNNKSIELDIAGLNSVYFPQINLSHNSFYTNDPLNAFGFKLQQEAIQTSDFNPSLLNTDHHKCIKSRFK
ncbi:MAG: hypothetical protein IPO16_09585 [Saprospiraceae bacterium]|nr:hypothetical protein [Saprospiraceae bacterium]